MYFFLSFFFFEVVCFCCFFVAFVHHRGPVDGNVCRHKGSNHFGPVECLKRQAPLEPGFLGWSAFISVCRPSLDTWQHNEKTLRLERRSEFLLSWEKLRRKTQITLKMGFKKRKKKKRIDVAKKSRLDWQPSCPTHPLLASLRQKVSFFKHNLKISHIIICLLFFLKTKEKQKHPPAPPSSSGTDRTSGIVECCSSRECTEVTSVSWRRQQVQQQRLSGCWVWHHPWLLGPGCWRWGLGSSPPGCGAGWRAGRGVGGGRPRWTSVSCGRLPPWVAVGQVEQMHNRRKNIEFVHVLSCT